jgi:hypothetical protein
MPTCISTLRPPRRLGSIRSKSGAQSLPERRSQALLSRPSLNSKAHIEALIDSHNETAKPFAWQRSEVHQKRLKPRFAHQ